MGHGSSNLYLLDREDSQGRMLIQQSPEIVNTFFNSSFGQLGGVGEFLLIDKIIVYLSAKDLCLLSMTCKYFNQICQSKYLWNQLYYKDFALDNYTDSELSFNSGRLILNSGNHFNNNLLASRLGLNFHDPHLKQKSHYIRRYHEYKEKLLRGKQELHQFEAEISRFDRIRTIEFLLDLIQLRLFFPIYFASAFLSIVLFCQRIDGLNISYWACALPFMSGIVYIILSLFLVSYIFRRESVNDTWRRIWNYLQGPIVSLYKISIPNSKTFFYLALSILLNFLALVILVTVKISFFTPEYIRDGLSWGIVFIPIWLFCLFYCYLPWNSLLRFDSTLYFMIFFLVWIPLIIFFICLTVKLEKERNIRLSLMLIPTFYVEGLILIIAIVAFIVNYFRFRRGIIGRLDESLVLLALSFFVLSPIIIFQSLLSARDDHQMGHQRYNISATEVASPILIIIGMYFLVTSFVSLTIKTGFQEFHESTLIESAGLRIIYSV